MKKVFLFLILFIIQNNVMAQTLKGDVNGDKIVNVDDITEVINIICSPESEQSSSQMLDGHEYVDLGLPSGTLWATCNIGANSPEESGYYFAWGDTQGYLKESKHVFSSATYVFIDPSYTGGMPVYTKYKLYDDLKWVLESIDDAATANWGKNWCLPTQIQLNELLVNCTWEFQTINNRKVAKITGKNGKYIIIPLAGNFRDKDLIGYDIVGFYWSSSVTFQWEGYCMCLNIYEGFIDIVHNSRDYGMPIRPVLKK